MKKIELSRIFGRKHFLVRITYRRKSARNSFMARIDNLTWEQWPALAARTGYSVAGLSRILDICPRRLHRCIWRVHGKSPRHWLLELRLTPALDILRATGVVKVAAYELGYKDVAQFSRAFKLCFGLCPSSFLASVTAHAVVPGARGRPSKEIRIMQPLKTR